MTSAVRNNEHVTLGQKEAKEIRAHRVMSYRQTSPCWPPTKLNTHLERLLSPVAAADDDGVRTTHGADVFQSGSTADGDCRHSEVLNRWRLECLTHCPFRQHVTHMPWLSCPPWDPLIHSQSVANINSSPCFYQNEPDTMEAAEWDWCWWRITSVNSL